MTDCIATCKRAPVAGETVVGNSFNIYLGGKGANQAFAAKRMGSEVYLSGAVGNDEFGKEFLEALKKEGFKTNSVVIIPNNSTGVSLVTVENNGQNRIVMTPGANLDYTVEDLLKFENIIKKVDYVLTQCEMAYEIIVALSKLCKKHNKHFILNPAPAQLIEDDVLNGLYCITPNETEIEIITGKKLDTLEDYKKGAKVLLEKGCQNIVVTLGEKGSLLVNKKESILVPAFKVKAIDTVGAGDSYTGSLTAMLDQGRTIKEAMKIATAVAALEVQKKGAIPAMPYKEDVFSFINKYF